MEKASGSVSCDLSLNKDRLSGRGNAVSPVRETEKASLEPLLTSQESGGKMVAANHHRAGACTHTLPTARRHVPSVQDEEQVKGVFSIFWKNERQIQEFKWTFSLLCSTKPV